MLRRPGLMEWDLWKGWMPGYVVGRRVVVVVRGFTGNVEEEGRKEKHTNAHHFPFLAVENKGSFLWGSFLFYQPRGLCAVIYYFRWQVAVFFPPVLPIEWGLKTSTAGSPSSLPLPPGLKGAPNPPSPFPSFSQSPHSWKWLERLMLLN